MIIFLKTPLTPYDFGAFGLLFIIATGLLKLLTYIIKKKYEAEKRDLCKATKDGVCPLINKTDTIYDYCKKLDEIHCGRQAIGPDGIPRWYMNQEAKEKLNKMHDTLVNLDVKSKIDKIYELIMRQDTKDKTDKIYDMLIGFREIAKNQFLHGKGQSEKISKESIKLYNKLCGFINDAMQTHKDIPMIKDEGSSKTSRTLPRMKDTRNFRMDEE